MQYDLAAILAGRKAERFTRIDQGDLTIHPHLRPCRLKILMVVDGYTSSFLTVSFSHSYFGLSAVLDTLREDPDYFVKYEVTRAHRQIDDFKPDPVTQPALYAKYGPHFENFRFAAGGAPGGTVPAGFDIYDYDQVWLFGARSENDPLALTDAELEVLARWMDDGGGVFATGDHADLGASLCARVPRVRSMRRWTAAQGAPSPGGPNRRDTLLKGSNPAYTFDDESDDRPMSIAPTFYDAGSWSPFVQRQAPHPILCGKDGVITILPDHPHEGEVIDDNQIDLTAQFSFGSYQNKPEYPAPAAGDQPAPQVIARASVQSDHTGADFKGVVTGRSFGVIGAYDGHDADVGRVVVDSTWHHWFDVNLTGRPVGALDSLPQSEDNPKVLGFLATPGGQASYARIQNYFRNVALWLAPQDAQRCMFLRAMWGAILRYPAVERLDLAEPIWVLGGIAYDAIGRRANQCLRSKWLIELSPDLIPVFKERLIPRPDPCLTCPPIELFETYILGGITRELLGLAYELERAGTPPDGQPMDEETVAKAFIVGASNGARELIDTYRRSIEEGRRLSDMIGERLARLPSAEEFFAARSSRRRTQDERQTTE